MSPGQITAMLPESAALAATTLSVISAGKTVGTGSVSVAAVAPGIFQLDAGGTGAIVNGVTGALQPFRVVTTQNPTPDTRTRLSIYGTGFRYAGNPAHAPSQSNIAAAMTATAVDPSGAAANPVTGCLTAGSAIWILLQFVFAPGKFIIFSSALQAKLQLETTPISLKSIAVLNDADYTAIRSGKQITQNDVITVDPGSSTNFHVVGNFSSVPGLSANSQLAELVAEQLLDDVLGPKRVMKARRP